jgi:hypothetical protein
MIKKIVHVQTVLFEDDVKTLKKITDYTTVKCALSQSVAHYIKVVGSLTDKQKNKLKCITGEQEIDAAILKAILMTIG